MYVINVEKNPKTLTDEEVASLLNNNVGAPIIEGEGTPTPMAEWDVALFLCANKQRTLYGLEVVEFGNQSEREKDNGWEPIDRFISVATKDVKGLSEEQLAKALFLYHQEHSSRFITGVTEMGRYDLWDELELSLQ